MERLPQEILSSILTHLPFDELIEIGRVCKHFFRVGSDEMIWKRKCLQDFPTKFAITDELACQLRLSKYQLPDSQATWKDQYLNLYANSTKIVLSQF